MDDHLYSDGNLPMPLTTLNRAEMLFTPEETAVLKRGGLFIKTVDPRHHMVNRPSGRTSRAKILSARVTRLRP